MMTLTGLKNKIRNIILNLILKWLCNPLPTEKDFDEFFGKLSVEDIERCYHNAVIQSICISINAVRFDNEYDKMYDILFNEMAIKYIEKHHLK